MVNEVSSSSRPVQLFSLLVGLALVAGGCGDSPIGQQPHPYTEFAEQRNALLGELVCKSFFSCSERPPIQVPYQSEEACLTDFEDDDSLSFGTEFRGILESIRAGRIDFDQQAANECLDEMELAVEMIECNPTPEPTLEIPICESVLQPQRAEDQPCKLGLDECQGDLICRRPNTEVCYGVCTEPDTSNQTIKEEGESCTEAGDVCDPTMDLQCTPLDDMGDQRCLREGTVAEGDKCKTSSICQPNLVCSMETCKSFQVVSQGSDCDQQTKFCETGYACIGESMGTGTCQEFSGIGDSCDNALDCADGLYCDRAPGMLGTCQERIAAGDMCNENKSNQCETGLTCVFRPSAGNAICQFPTAESCEIPEM
jgi:hypothetical protein